MIARRRFLRDLGISAAAFPLFAGMPSLNAQDQTRPKQRLILFFSPNGTLPALFWPDETGAAKLKRILAPLEPFRKQLLTLKGISNKVRGDGDGHMRGMSCLLTGKELFREIFRGDQIRPPAGAAAFPLTRNSKTSSRLIRPQKPGLVRWTWAWPSQPGDRGPGGD